MVLAVGSLLEGGLAEAPTWASLLRSCIASATQNTMHDSCMLQIEHLQGRAGPGTGALHPNQRREGGPAANRRPPVTVPCQQQDPPGCYTHPRLGIQSFPPLPQLPPLRWADQTLPTKPGCSGRMACKRSVRALCEPSRLYSTYDALLLLPNPQGTAGPLPSSSSAVGHGAGAIRGAKHHTSPHTRQDIQP